MKSQKSIGLDELMIINPGLLVEMEAGNAGFFLGDDGTLYQVQGLSGEASDTELAEFYLGDDGSLYQLHGLETLIASEAGRSGMAGTPRLPRAFLGEDGTLYEIRNQ